MSTTEGPSLTTHFPRMIIFELALAEVPATETGSRIGEGRRSESEAATTMRGDIVESARILADFDIFLDALLLPILRVDFDESCSGVIETLTIAETSSPSSNVISGRLQVAINPLFEDDEGDDNICSLSDVSKLGEGEVKAAEVGEDESTRTLPTANPFTNTVTNLSILIKELSNDRSLLLLGMLATPRITLLPLSNGAIIQGMAGVTITELDRFELNIVTSSAERGEDKTAETCAEILMPAERVAISERLQEPSSVDDDDNEEAFVAPTK